MLAFKKATQFALCCRLARNNHYKYKPNSLPNVPISEPHEVLIHIMEVTVFPPSKNNFQTPDMLS